ncbi:FMN-binding protein [Actinoplanes sp. NPDC023801]|uniref:FMN-binding protein n=1 Tax=Actinoplanes sp. NPDC023801 TaxID=3154595 RepID=UPI0033C3A22F
MRRSTAAAVGTLTGAALILGVRLSVQPATVPVSAAAAGNTAEEPEIDEAGEKTAEPEATATKKPSGKKTTAPAEQDKQEEAGLKSGTFKGKAVQHTYGTVQVTIKISGGKITAADATFPKEGFSGTINPNAVKSLNSSALKKQSADVDAVSGATLTSGAYASSLQAALDKAA